MLIGKFVELPGENYETISCLVSDFKLCLTKWFFSWLYLFNSYLKRNLMKLKWNRYFTVKTKIRHLWKIFKNKSQHKTPMHVHVQTTSGLRSAGKAPPLRHDWSGMHSRPHPFSPSATGRRHAECVRLCVCPTRITGVHLSCKLIVPLLPQTSVLFMLWCHLLLFFCSSCAPLSRSRRLTETRPLTS